MRRLTLASLAVLSVLVAAYPLMAQVPSFSADTKFSTRDLTSTGKLYFNGAKVRMEINMQGHSSMVIADQDRKIADMIVPDQRMYMEMSTDDPQHKHSPSWQTYNPNHPCANVEDMTCQKIGAETVSGYLCNKWLFTGVRQNAGVKITTWIDRKTSIPIKSQTAQGTMEIYNIHLGPQPDSLFEVPASYQKFDMGPVLQDVRQDEEQGVALRQ